MPYKNFHNFISDLKRGQKAKFAILIDPDKFNLDLILMANHSNASCFLLGGSVIKSGSLESCLAQIKKHSTLPVFLFPGDETQLSKKADGLFLPSLVSGRNADYLIGKQIIMAPIIKKFKLKSAAMAYLLIDGKSKSTTQKVSKTAPLSSNDIQQIVNTCLASEQLGFQLIYLEAGSGAIQGINATIIKAVKKEISLPLIVGGGINSAEKVKRAIKAGANLIVVGNALEKNVHLLTELSDCFKK